MSMYYLIFDRCRRLLVVGLISALFGCYGPNVATEAAVNRMSSGNSILFLSSLNNQVFGTRPEGGLQKMTSIYETDWNANETLAAKAIDLIKSSGRSAYAIRASEIKFQKDDRAASQEEALFAISKEMASQNPDVKADVHLIVVPLPLDRYGSIRRYGGYLLTWGFLGLVSHAQEEFRPAFVVRVNDSLAAAFGNKVECLGGYSLAVVDAHTHSILTVLTNRVAFKGLPDDFWIGDYRSLTESQTQEMKNACVGAVSDYIEKDLRSLGIGS